MDCGSGLYQDIPGSLMCKSCVSNSFSIPNRASPDYCRCNAGFFHPHDTEKARSCNECELNRGFGWATAPVGRRMQQRIHAPIRRALSGSSGGQDDPVCEYEDEASLRAEVKDLGVEASAENDCADLRELFAVEDG